MDALAPLLTENYVNRKLFDALLLGLVIRMMMSLLTLMGMLAIAPRLSEKNRSDRLLRVVKRLESDRSPKYGRMWLFSAGG